MADVRLVIDGAEYGGWTEVRVVRTLDALCASFTLTLTDRWQVDDKPLSLYPGLAVRLYLDDTMVITGYIDEVRPKFSATGHSIVVSGRDKTADLVDCSAMHNSGEFLNQTVEQIARTLSADFDVTVLSMDSAGSSFSVFKLQPGETVFEAIERACRQRGVIPSTDSHGRLAWPTLGKTRADALVQGKNILEADARHSLSNRYSKYIVSGQRQSSDDVSGLNSTSVKGTAKDPGVERYRPLRIIAETQATPESATERAGWEANVRAARSSEVTVKVQGWQMSTGGLWPLGGMSRVSIPYLFVDQDLLIKAIEFSLSAAGTITSLTLCRKDAYTRKPESSKDLTYGPDIMRTLVEDAPARDERWRGL